MIDQKVLHELLDYDPDTGIFLWKRDRGGLAKSGSIAGRISDKGYNQISVMNKRYNAHRLAWLYVHGEWPPQEIDHINGHSADNRIENLRCVSRGENAKNTRIRKNSPTGVLGVTWHVGKKRWQAKLAKKQLGRFRSFDEAVLVRKSAEAAAGYHENHGRL